MADRTAQSYANHRRFVPGFHFVVVPILVVNALWKLWGLMRTPGWETFLAAAVAVSLVMLSLFARAFALQVQNRVIRLEERLRLARLLPADQVARLDELGTAQLIALRFASDGEVVALCQRALDEKLDRQAIKKSIRDWRGDYLRA